LDTGVTECVKIDECDVLNYVNVMTQADDDVTLINNADIMHAEISSDDNDNQIGSAVSSIDHLSNVETTLTANTALTSDSLPSEPTSRSEHDNLRDEQKADSTWKKAWLWAQKNKNYFFVKDELLYHRDKVLQQNVQQLCSPMARGNEVCRMLTICVTKGTSVLRKN